MTRSRGLWRVIVAVASLLALGAAAGIAADRLLHQRPARPSDSNGVHFRDEHVNPVEVFDRAVGLRPEQRTRVAAILEKRQADVNAAWLDARTRFRATVDSVTAEISAELDADQVDRFRALVDSLHGLHRERPLHH